MSGATEFIKRTGRKHGKKALAGGAGMGLGAALVMLWPQIEKLVDNVVDVKTISAQVGQVRAEQVRLADEIKSLNEINRRHWERFNVLEKSSDYQQGLLDGLKGGSVVPSVAGVQTNYVDPWPIWSALTNAGHVAQIRLADGKLTVWMRKP